MSIINILLSFFFFFSLKKLIILLQFLLSFGIYYNPQKLFSEERQLHWFKFITVMIRKSFSPFRFFRANKALDLLLVVISVQFSSVAQLCLTLRPHEPQHTRPPCLSPTPGVYPNSCPLSWWCHPIISYSVVPFSSCLQCFTTSGSFQVIL